MALQTSATINGKTYYAGTAFNARVNFTGKAASDGTGNNSTITAGNQYNFRYYNPGSKYPYAIGTGTSSAVRCWVQATVFPYATYKVSFNANGGSGAPGAQTKTYGTNLKLSNTKPSRAGHTFLGWGTSSSDTSVDYAPGATYTANKAITLYAICRVNTYTISFDANGGSGAPGAQTKTYGVDLTLRSTVPVREGHIFLGWSTSKTATSATYTAGGKCSINSNATLYAVWKLITYTVTFDASTNEGIGNTIKTVNYGGSISTMPSASRPYYVFIGWFTSPEGGTEITEDYEFYSDMTLYAQFVIDASIHVRDGGVENPGFPYVWKDGAWKKGYARVWDNDTWKQGLG